jgi:hypothetical protein
MSGNRWPDVCALCDRPIDLSKSGWLSLHLYVGRGVVHGGGRERIPVHHGCIYLKHLNGDEPVYADVVKAVAGA